MVTSTHVWRRLARTLAPALRRERRAIGIGLFALGAEVVLRLAEPWPLKVVFDRVFMVGKGARHLPALPWTPSQLVLAAAIATVLFTSLRALASYVQAVRFALVGNSVISDLRAVAFRKLQYLSLAYHTRARAGDLTVRMTSDIGMLQDVTVTALLPLAGDIALFVGMAGLMVWMSPTLALLAALPLPVYLWRTRSLGKKLRENARVQRKREGALASTVNESVSAIRTVQSMQLHEVVARGFHRDNRRAMEQGARGKRLSAGLERSVDVLIAVSTAGSLWGGAQLVWSGALTPGDLLVFLAYLKNAFKPLQSFAKYTGRVAKAGAAAERVLDLLDRAPEIVDRPDAIEAPPFRGEIAFEHLTFAYDDTPILRDITVTIPAGRLVAIVGASGSGKSTFLNLLLRLYDPTTGCVRIDGRDLRDYRIASVRSQVSVILQESALFAGTIRQNLALVAPNATDQEFREALRCANALEFVDRLPGGLDAAVSEKGSTLSSGQRQRIALARAALRENRLLLLDEPTTGLDDANARLVSDAILELARARTTFVVTHDPRFAAKCDLVLVLAEGRLVEQGSPEELMAIDSIFRRSVVAFHTKEPRSGVPHART